MIQSLILATLPLSFLTPVYLSQCAEFMNDRKVEYEIVRLFSTGPNSDPEYKLESKTRKCGPQD